MNDDVFQEVVRYLSEDFDIPAEKIQRQSRMVEDLELDSIDGVNLMVKFQEITGAKVTAEQFASISTVEDLINLIVSLRARA